MDHIIENEIESLVIPFCDNNDSDVIEEELLWRNQKNKNSSQKKYLTVTVVELKTLDATGKSNILFICVYLLYLWENLSDGEGLWTWTSMII